MSKQEQPKYDNTGQLMDSSRPNKSFLREVLSTLFAVPVKN